MLEKGLSMSPRRPVFAEAYIEELVETFMVCTTDDLTRQWAWDVLEAYFEAVPVGRSAPADRARRLFESSRSDTEDFDATGRAVKRLSPAPLADTKPSHVQPSELRELCEARQSVRSFLPKVVDRGIVDEAIRTGIQAPSACNRLPYRFLVLERPDDAREVAALVGGTAGYLEKIQSLLVVVGDLSAYGHPRDRHLIYTDAGLAIMGVLLSLESHGVSSCCINWPSLSALSRRAARLVGLENHERVVMLIAYGYGDSESAVPASGKKDLAAVRAFTQLGNRES
ncbi:nitroreductase family protein [Gordonia sp. NPDC057258]|uniref:nitroreductase family protein n=1 Tax=unclassified Gordonia (in: high G+C Gram-positive bacteria) TaxID=2657482 RepID=UPI00362F053F